MDLDALRQRFPHTERWAYLDHASTGPLSTTVLEAVHAFLEERHRTSPNNFASSMPKVARARERAAEVLGTATERVGLAPNTSYALNVLALGLDWQEGDRVAVPGCEFPANVYPWLQLRERGVEVDFIPHRACTFSLADVERALTPRTRLVAVSWVQFLSGFRTDLGALGRLCREHGALLSVDAIQGLGALRLDLAETPVDFLATGAQKWLLGMQGTAFFYVSEALQERLRPVRGWQNGPVDWDDFLAYPLDLHPDARRFRLGTLNTAGFVALDAALGQYLEAGPEWCEAQILARARQAAEGLDRLGLRRYGPEGPPASGIVTAEHPDAAGLVEALAGQGIQAAARDRKLRLSPSYYTTEEEVGRALEAVAAYGRTQVAASG